MSKEYFASLGKEENSVLGFKGVGVLVTELAASCLWRGGSGRVRVTPRTGLAQS